MHAAFGQPTHQIWPELEDFTDPIYSAVLQGQVRTYSEQRFTLQRDGRDSDFWLDLTYSPTSSLFQKPITTTSIKCLRPSF